MPMRAELPIRKLSVDDGNVTKSWDTAILVGAAVMLMLLVLVVATLSYNPRALDQPTQEQGWIIGP